jgi:hypothetical protein
MPTRGNIAYNTAYSTYLGYVVANYELLFLPLIFNIFVSTAQIM